MYDKGDFAGARSAFEQALNTFQKIGDGEIGVTTVSLGNVYYEQGKLEEARRYYEQALRFHQETGANPANIGSDIGSIALVLDGLGDLVGATRMHEKSLQGFRDGGDQRGETATLENLAGVLVERGELSQAMSDYQQGISIAEKIGYKEGRAFNLGGLAQISLIRDQVSQARDQEDAGPNVPERSRRPGRDCPEPDCARHHRHRARQAGRGRGAASRGGAAA